MKKNPDDMNLSPKTRSLLNDVAELLRTDKLALTLSIIWVYTLLHLKNNHPYRFFRR